LSIIIIQLVFHQFLQAFLVPGHCRNTKAVQ